MPHQQRISFQIDDAIILRDALADHYSMVTNSVPPGTDGMREALNDIGVIQARIDIFISNLQGG